MSTENLIMVIDKENFQVKLDQNLLEVDLKKGLRKKLEDALESSPGVRGSMGFLFQHVIPLDVSLKDIESVKFDEKNRVKIVIPHRRDIIIPLQEDEGKKLIEKLNELIPVAKQKELERLLSSLEANKELISEVLESKRGKSQVLGKKRG
jgi:hypothetical protein